MPYIMKKLRPRVRVGGIPRDVGELNFAITVLLNSYLLGQSLSYGTINDILGAVEGAKQEFYRRIAIPYEDLKIKQNGDVYDYPP
jgi:hypothetical protein